MAVEQADPQGLQDDGEQIFVSTSRLWLAAIKPPIYSVAIVPILAGTVVAYLDDGSFQLSTCLTFLLSGILIIAWLNLSNDVFDADTGIDINKAHSVVNLTGNQNLVFWIANFCLALGCSGIVLISWWQKDLTVLATVMVCCGLGYSYQGPPFRLGYLGLGEIICFFTFGPGAVSAAYYAQSQSYSVSCLAVSVLVGLSTSVILFCSHFHQVEDDLAAGKKSPIVRLGTLMGARVLSISLASFYLLATIFCSIGYLPLSGFMVFLSLPIAFQLARHVRINHDCPSKVSNSKFIAINFYLVSFLCLASGIVIFS